LIQQTSGWAFQLYIILCYPTRPEFQEHVRFLTDLDTLTIERNQLQPSNPRLPMWNAWKLQFVCLSHMLPS